MVIVIDACHSIEVHTSTITSVAAMAPALRRPCTFIERYECPLVAIDGGHALEVHARTIAAALRITPAMRCTGDIV